MREVCAGFEAGLKQFNGEQDHVHLLVHHPPTVQLSKLVDSLKGVSSRRLRLAAPPGRRPGKSTTATSAGTCWADTSGPAPPSPDHAAGHP